ncbi:MAG TPA: prolyl oligopeptidase family serine peptidase [Candidatus Dormibacteraeota bacterium]|nr:prolyl oligopeptidase family serine peptidase [Candidatus Dormibacteraeota bacterium]
MGGPIGAEDLYRFRWIDHVRLSRDGERVAYQVTWADMDSRQNRSRVVVRRLLESEPIEPTGGPHRDHSPEWSSDGRRLAFISKVGPADQLFVLDFNAGGETRRLSSIPEGAASPLWSPDGSRIAFIGTVMSDPEAVVDDPRPPESRDQVRRAPVARIARRLDYKHDGQGYVDGRYHHLFVVSVTSGNVTQLTSGAWDVTGFDWDPDGTRLIASGNAEPGADLQRELNLYVVDLAGNRHRLGGGLTLSAPAWSPRGDLIAFIAPNGLDAGLLERLWVVPLTGEPPRCLTASFDLAVNDSVITDMRAGHSSRLAWSSEGDRVFFLASGPGVTSIYSCDLEGNVRQEAGGQRRIFDFDIASGVLAFAASDSNNPGELQLTTQGAEARLTDLNPWLRDRYIAQLERHQFTAPDGWMIEGWVMKPPGLDPGKVHPLVLQIHGGPHGQYGWALFHELQVLAGMGYVVLCVNPRGSDGYGERFRREVVRDWGGKDYADLMSALDQTIARTGYVDTNRLGIGGGSYGGYMTNWAIGQTDRFSAAVSMRSIANLVSEYAQHDIVLWGALELGPPPYPDTDELWKRSPIRYVQKIRTPLLLTCGEMDLRCAISQSEEMFGAMRLLGKTVELVRFPEESHDLSRSGRPDRRVERLRRIAGWYERFLGTAATDRIEEEAATQVLPIPVFATQEAPPAPVVEIAPQPEPEPVPEPLLLAEYGLDESVEMAHEPAPEPEAVPQFHTAEALAELTATDTLVLETLTPAEPDTAEPDAVPVFPGPEQALDEVPAEHEPTPELQVAATEVKTEPVVAAQEPELEPEPEPELLSEPEPEPLIAAQEPESEPEHEPEPEPEPEPLIAAQEPEPEPEPELEPEPEPIVASEELEPEPEPDVAAEEPAPAPEPEAEPVVAAQEPEPEPKPEPVVAAVALAPEPEPEPVAAEPWLQAEQPGTAAAGDQPAEHVSEPAARAEAADPVKSTMIRWPGGTAPGNGSRSTKTDTFDEATSIIPAWRHPNDPPDSKRTVSLQALPIEQITAGAGFAALLTFESGPFAGRIVALPNQMVTVGRAPDNDIVVGDPATSGHHGRIEQRNGFFWISDLGSTNGTMVNGEPVIEKQLSEGDMIAIGQNTMRFTLES